MWLPLADYSMKHKVSISTLRRRIKAEDIQYRLDDGKYFIFETAPAFSVAPIATTATTLPATTTTQQPKSETHRPSLKSEFSDTDVAQISTAAVAAAAERSSAGESVITAANRLLTDLKKAYTQVLQDKEEQILNLKEEISDLRTLVRVLESENARLEKNNPNSQTGYSHSQNLDY